MSVGLPTSQYVRQFKEVFKGGKEMRGVGRG